MVDGDEEGQQTDLKVVSDNSDSQAPQVKKPSSEFARYEVETKLARLACNLMRISRGAGEPYQLLSDCLKIIDAFQSYYDAAGHFPGGDLIKQSVSFRPERDGWQEDFERVYSIEQITSGALQFAASRIGGHHLQERAGENELLDGVRSYQQYIEDERAKYAAKYAPAIKRKPAPKKKISKKTSRGL